MSVALNHAVRSDVGHVRTQNEDAGFASNRLIAVADGVGGNVAGEVASRIAIARMAALDVVAAEPDPVGALQSAALAANQDLRDYVAADPALTGMSTTLTAVLAADEQLALVHVGDSRCYLFRDGVLTQLTRDHTFVQTLVDTGQITLDEAAVHPQRSIVTRVLDGQTGVDLDLSVRPACAGDRYLVCTDGLPGVVTDETISAALALPTLAAAAERLIDLALRGGGPDNVTVVVADVVPAGQPDVDEEDVEVAGSAADDVAEPVRPPTSSAARAAVAAGQARRARRVPDLVTPGRLRRVLGALALPVLALLVIGAGILGTWIYIQHQYYVGVSGTRVAVFRGVSGSVGPIHLSSVKEYEMPVDELLPAYQQRVRAGISAKNLAAADQVVANLRGDEIPVVHPTAPKSKSKATGKSTTTSTSTSTTTSSAEPTHPAAPPTATPTRTAGT